MVFNPYANTLNLPFFIAEIGINHNGDMEICKKMIDAAKEAGCDAVKFQRRTIDVVYTPEYLAACRQSPWGTTQRAQKEGLELSEAQYDEVDAYCKQVGIIWFASAWDMESQKRLKKYDLPLNKVASAMLTHGSLLEEIASEGKHTFISTGMSNYGLIHAAVDVFQKTNCPFTLMHCVSSYPTKIDDCNINMIKTLREMYPGTPIGYSGHELGIVPSILAISLGAVSIERHITLDKTMYGSDQSASIEPQEFKQLVEEGRNVTNILGTGQKQFLQHEREVEKKLRYF